MIKRSLLSVVLLVLSVSPAFARHGEDDIEELKRIQDTNSKILADTVQNLNAIRQEIQGLRGEIEESKHAFDQSSQDNQKVMKDLDMRMTGVEEKMSLYEGQVSELGKGKGGKGDLPGDEGALYRKAIGEVNAQNFKGAMALFDQFLKKYPKSQMADNAQYWKGECYYGLKQYPEAVLEFQKVVKRYPKSEKAAAAVLKQGYAFYEVKSYQDAKAFLQKVLTQYPKSEEAAKAKDKIQQINQALKGGSPRAAATPTAATPSATPPAPTAPAPSTPTRQQAGPADDSDSDLVLDGHR